MSHLNRELLKNKTLLKEQYLILTKLSKKGGRLTVLARDTYSEDLVVIKILLFGNGLFQWDDFKLFEREAQTLKNLDHPAIPKYLNYFEIDEKNIRGFALVQTYIDALSLETVMKEGRKFSELELIEFAEKLLDILIYLHQQIPPVIHRDIKPSNILIANRSGNSIGDLYLVDFGAAQITASKENGTITIVGTYGYIPLEQFGGQTTTASDLYSLGMTLIYLMTGVHPAELPQVNGRVKLNSSDISGKLGRWLDKMTDPHLDKRFNSAKAALTALKSKDGSSGDFLDLRPVYSQVKLHRDLNQLKITYPFCRYYSPACLLVGLLLISAIVFSTFIYPVFWMQVSVIIIIYVWGMSLIFFPPKPQSYTDIYTLLIDQSYTDTYTLLIDQSSQITQGIYSSKNPKKAKKGFLSSRVKDINLIVYNPGYIFNKYVDATGRHINSGRVVVDPTLSVYAGHIQFKIGESSIQKLSQAELWWLGQELSDFLGLELQVIYPTPKAPPENTAACGGC